jgi:hypothetical protein
MQLYIYLTGAANPSLSIASRWLIKWTGHGPGYKWLDPAPTATWHAAVMNRHASNA